MHAAEFDRSPGESSQLEGVLERWMSRLARRRLRKEWEAFKDMPETRVGLFSRAPRKAGQQVFRSLIQVNIYRGGN